CVSYEFSMENAMDGLGGCLRPRQSLRGRAIAIMAPANVTTEQTVMMPMNPAIHCDTSAASSIGVSFVRWVRCVRWVRGMPDITLAVFRYDGGVPRRGMRARVREASVIDAAMQVRVACLARLHPR